MHIYLQRHVINKYIIPVVAFTVENNMTVIIFVFILSVRFRLPLLRLLFGLVGLNNKLLVGFTIVIGLNIGLINGLVDRFRVGFVGLFDEFAVHEGYIASDIVELYVGDIVGSYVGLYDGLYDGLLRGNNIGFELGEIVGWGEIVGVIVGVMVGFLRLGDDVGQLLVSLMLILLATSYTVPAIYNDLDVVYVCGEVFIPI